MNIPTEILAQIAAFLNAEDLGTFRLLNRQCARVGISLIAQNGLSIMNTSAELREFRKLLQCKSFSTSARQLTVNHGAWPVCTREEWEIHPLLFGGQPRLQTLQEAKTDQHFASYSAFITEEQNRTLNEDVDAISQIFTMLSNLRTLVISHMKVWSWHPSRNTRYQNLQQEIWMTPYINEAVAPAVQTCLLALSDRFPNINSLMVYGRFNPAELYRCPVGLKFPSIYKLYIVSLQLQENEDAIQNFLQAFPNLVDLSLKFKNWSPLVPNFAGKLVWPHLKTLRLDDIWASEQGFFSIFKDHQYSLELFSLGNATIVQGSWRSLFTKIRALEPKCQISADGELYGRRSKDTLFMNHAALTLLRGFIRDRQAPWPFSF
jgi:hypothetical protein